MGPRLAAAQLAGDVPQTNKRRPVVRRRARPDTSLVSMNGGLANFAKGLYDKSDAIRTGIMPTRNVSLTPEQDDFIQRLLKKGEYQNASEAMRDAIRALQQRRAMDALKLKRLKQAIDAGLTDLDRGDYEEVDDSDLEAWFDSVDLKHP